MGREEFYNNKNNLLARKLFTDNAGNESSGLIRLK